jgi:hypothetical protein
MTVNSAEIAFQSYFSERGILPETVEANGIRLASPDETYKAVKALLPAIRWDYGNGYQRYRFLGDPDTFPKNEKSQPVKAKAVKGSGNRLYIPVRPGQSSEQLNAAKEDPSIPIAIVEGEADTLGVLQAEPDALVVGISGCWGWKSKKDPILPELRALAKPGRVAVLCPDSDWAVNPKVFQGWLALGTVLKQLGCNVQVVAIESDSGKLGAGDYIHKFGAETWAGLTRMPLGQWESQGNEIHSTKSKKAEAKSDGVARGGESTRAGSLSRKLVELALEIGSLWHDSTGHGWIDFTVGGVLQTARIRSKRFQDYLADALWQRYRYTPSSEAWSQAVRSLEGQARRNPEREAFLRVAQYEGSVYIDLRTEDWQIVRVSPDGWEIIPYSDCPVRFYRPECQLPLPIPTRGGSLDDLWRLLNFKESDRPLVLGWILSCFTPDGSKPILALSGAKGSGKSSAARLLKQLTDPTHVDMAGGVEDQRQFAVAAANRWVLCFDNLTHLSSEQQNLLCRASTGGGFSYRALYSDLEEVTVNYRRPQILTGVDLVPTRSDLLERCLIVRLERIPEKNRLSERKLKSQTSDLLPGIFGSLLDLMVVALRNLPTINLDELPRMADFAELCVAAGIPNFVEAYSTNINVGSQEAAEANPITSGILSLLEAHNDYWHGSSTELIRRLQELDPTNREFQKLSARSIGRKLSSSLRGDLKAVGVEVDQGRGTNGQRYLILSRTSSSQPDVSQTPTSGHRGSGAKEQTSQTSTPTQNKGSMDNTTASAPTPTTKNSPAIEATNAHSRTGDNGISSAGHPEQKKGTSPAPQVESGSLTPRASNSNGLPVGNAASNPEVLNAGDGSQRVRFLDQDPVRPDLRGREAQLERETIRTAVVWVDGVRQRVPKDWLVEGSTSPGGNQNGSPLPRTEGGVATGFSTAGNTGTKSSTGRSDKPATNGSPATSRAESKGSRPLSEEWKGLLNACCRAGVSHLHIRQVLSEATGIPKEVVCEAPLTRSQYRQAMDYLANYRSEEGSPT